MESPVLVSGASSQLGVFLLPRLRAAGFRVLALSRQASAEPLETADGVFWIHPNAALGDDTAARFQSVPDLVSAGPLNQAISLVRAHPGLRRVVAFSTSSVSSKAGSDDPGERRQVARIAQQEAGLSRICRERGVALLLLRPTLIYGCGLDRNVSLLARFGNRFGFIPLAGKAQGLRQPVHADDLAELAERALTAATAPDFSSAACGGGTLTYRAMTEKVAASCSRKVRVIKLPRWMMKGAVRALSLLPSWRGLNQEMVARQSRNLVFDDSELRESLAWDPRPFEPAPSDFEIPEEAGKLQLDVRMGSE